MTDHAQDPTHSAPVGVEFELTPEEWVEVSMEHTARSKALREARRTVRLLLIVLFVALSLLAVLEGSPGLATTWLLAGGVLVAAIDPLLRRSQRNQLRKLAATGIATGTFGPHRVELRPEGMVDSTIGYEWLTRWPAIERVEEGEGAFLVYTGPNACLPIPHSAFPDAATLRRFSDTFYRLREQARESALGVAEAPVTERMGSGEDSPEGRPDGGRG